MKPTLDRISIGSFDGLVDNKSFENKGKASIKLHVKRNEGPYGNREVYFDHYYIISKLENGQIIFDQSIPDKKLIGKERFLKEVNDDLIQMDGYLVNATYHKRFPIISLQSVEGTLYQKIRKKRRVVKK